MAKACSTYAESTSTASPGWRRRASTAATIPSSVWVGGIRTSTIATSGRCSSTAARNVAGVAGGGHHVQRLGPQQQAQPFPQQRVVLGDHDPHGSSTSIVVGPPGGLVRVRLPVVRLDPAADAGEAGARRLVGAAVAVVGDPQPQPAAAAAERDGGTRSRAAVPAMLVSASATTK